MKYLEQIPASRTHAGYFSIDKKGHIVNQVAGDDKKSKTSNDIDAYDLIMKNKELLLDRDPRSLRSDLFSPTLHSVKDGIIRMYSKSAH